MHLFIFSVSNSFLGAAAGLIVLMFRMCSTKNQLLITLVRHGETALNAKRVMQGQTDIPLSEIGKLQAEQLGKHISREVFTRAYSSDLSRAHLTAELILKHSEKPVEIKTDKRLRERCFGEYEGQHFTVLMDAASKTGESIIDYTPKGGESSVQVTARVASFFQDICTLTDSMESLDGENFLIVAHGGLIANLMRYLDARKDKFVLQNFNRAEANRIPPNTGLTRLAIDPSTGGDKSHRTITFYGFNEASHLTQKDCGTYEH